MKRFSTLLATRWAWPRLCQTPVAVAEPESRRLQAKLGNWRLFRRPLFQAQGLEQIGALGAFNHAHRHALAHAFQRAPRWPARSRWWRAVELQHKELLFVELLVGVGPHALHKGAAAIELIAFAPVNKAPEADLNSGLTVAVQRMPGAGRPRSRTPIRARWPSGPCPGGCRIVATDGQRRRGLGVAKGHGRRIELGHRLAHPPPRPGLKLTICNACACAANSNPPTSAVVARAFLQSVFIVFITLACRGMRACLRSPRVPSCRTVNRL